MIDDLAGYGPHTRFEADVCIVGAGAAGIAIAGELDASGLRVLLVESGGLRAEPETDRLKEGDVHGLASDALVTGRGRGLGGTTTLWAGQCIPLDEIDFEHRDWVPHSGWPIERSTLAMPYARAEALLGVPDEAYDEALWRRWRMAPPPIDPARLRHTYTAWSPAPDLGRARRRDLRRSANVRVLLHANVTAIVTNGARTAFDSVRVRSLGGSGAEIRARACVLSCGGIENARLLLASGDPESGGVANLHDNVGRFFQDHPNAFTGVLHSPSPRRLQESYSLFYRRGRRYLPKLALAAEAQRSERVLNCAANLDYEYADEGLNALRRIYRRARRGSREPSLGRDLKLAASGLPGAAATAYRRFALGRSSVSPPSAIRLQIHSEQAPSRDSRVLLARERDALGMNLPRVEWRVSDLERRTTQVMTDVVAGELDRLGLAVTERADWLLDPAGEWRQRLGDSYHHIGTTRMAADPAHGVVDGNCETHGVAGLYVAGSSVFPTSGFANPTLTIVALALRLADHLRRDLRRPSA